jgi:hypothetical protein
LSKKMLAGMQIFPGPRFLAKPSLRFIAQLPQPRPGVLCPVLVCGEICQVFADQTVDGRITFGGVAANSSQDVLVHAQSYILPPL